MARLNAKRKPLNQQTIVITGASSGIGLETALMAAQRGANVVISSRNEQDLKSIAADIRNKGGKALAVKADVSLYEDLVKVKDKAMAEFGSIDTWVNNAGTSIYGKILDTPEEEARTLFDINFWGIYYGCKVAVEAMNRNGGVIVNLGSEVSLRAVPLQGFYSASKHAVKALTDSLRMELEHDKTPIALSLIRPTAIDTPFTQHAVNHLEKGEPSLPNPTYHPGLVAEAILKCAVDPQRDVYVGATSKVAKILEFVAPRMTDYIAERVYFKEQSKGSKVPHTAENEGLMTAPKKEGRIRGGHKGPVRGQKQKAQQRRQQYGH
jgi:short-subunit dehydrogenase